MRLHYDQDPHGNFGDDLNPWLWSRLIPELIDDDGRTLFIGIGTVLRRDIPAGAGKVVFGAGVGYCKRPVLDERWRVYCVRGPETAAALGLDSALAMTDPAVLVRRFIDPAAEAARSGTAFIPHHESIHRAAAQGIDLQALAQSNGLMFIDPRTAVEEVLHAIRHAERIVTEAMHGAILADAFRVPWRAVRMYPHVLALKWIDWTASLRLAYRPTELSTPRPSRSELAGFLRDASDSNGGEWQLSQERVFDSTLARLNRSLEALECDHARGSLVVGESQDARPREHLKHGFPEPADSWWHAVATALAEIVRVTPGGAPIALAEDGQWAIDDASTASRVVLLPALSESYAGPPADDVSARAMLARVRQHGIRYVAVGWPAFWWLDTYEGLAESLTREWRCTHASAWCRVYEDAARDR